MANSEDKFKEIMKKIYADRVKSRSVNSSLEDYNVEKTYTDYDQENERDQAAYNRGLLEQARDGASPMDKYNAAHPPKNKFDEALRKLLKQKAQDSTNYWPPADEDKLY